MIKMQNHLSLMIIKEIQKMERTLIKIMKIKVERPRIAKI